MKRIMKRLFALVFLCLFAAVPVNAAGTDTQSAEEVSWGKETSGEITSSVSENWYYFTTSNKDEWTHIRFISKSMVYAQMTIYDADGAEIKELHVSKSNVTTLTEKFGTSETYYLRISGGYSGYEGNYVFSVTQIPDDVSDTFDQSRGLKDGEEFAGKLEAADDVDCFRFTTSGEDSWKQIQLVNKEADSTEVSLYDQNGVLLDSTHAFANQSSVLEKKLEKGKTYYLSVHPTSKYSNTLTGAYLLSWKEISDDAGDDMGSAFGIYSNTKYTKKLETSADKDFFRFQAGNTGNQVFTLKNVSGKNLSVTLYDTDGIMLESHSYMNAGSYVKFVRRLVKNQTYYLCVAGSAPGDYVINVNTGVSSVKLSKARVTLKKGRKVTVKAKVSPSGAANKKLVWSTGSSYVASVNQKGVITARRKGQTTIYCKTKDGTMITKKIIVVVK